MDDAARRCHGSGSGSSDSCLGYDTLVFPRCGVSDIGSRTGTGGGGGGYVNAPDGAIRLDVGGGHGLRAGLCQCEWQETPSTARVAGLDAPARVGIHVQCGTAGRYTL